MIKETLTKDTIKAELRKKYLHDAIKYGVGLLLCIAFFVIYLFKPQLYSLKITFWLVSPLIVYCIAVSLMYLYKTFKAHYLTRHDKIDVITDVLVDKSKKAQLSRHRSYHTYIFFFEKTGKYKIKADIFSVSNPYNMDNDQLYDLSQIDDEFYIIGVGKQKVILAYNKKFFELKVG